MYVPSSIQMSYLTSKVFELEIAGSWAEIFTAVGTLSAAIIALILGFGQRAIAIKAQQDLQNQYDEDLVRQAQAKAEKKERTSKLISAWVEDEYERQPNGNFLRKATLKLSNQSDEAVRRVTLGVLLGDVNIGHLSAPENLALLPSREVLEWDITVALAAYEFDYSTSVAVMFTDSSECRWLRNGAGVISEITGKAVTHFPVTSSQERNLVVRRGIQDAMVNPLHVVEAFLYEMHNNHQESSWVIMLDPYAKGWTTPGVQDEIPKLRDAISKNPNLGTFVTYSADNVAYVRLFPEQFVGATSTGDVPIEIPVLWISLVFREQIGWKIFSVGERTPPHRILFDV